MTGQRSLTTTTFIDWDALLESLGATELLILEQIYVREQGPLALQELQKRLRHLNLHPRTITRCCSRLATRGLLETVMSCDLQVCPLVVVEENVRKLVRLWQLRERRARPGLGGGENAP